MPAVHQSKRRISKSLSNSPNRPRTRRISVLRSLFSSKPLSQSNNVQWWGGGARRRGWSRRGPTSREAHTVRCAPTKPALRFADVHRSSSSSRAYPVPKVWYACSVVWVESRLPGPKGVVCVQCCVGHRSRAYPVPKVWYACSVVWGTEQSSSRAYPVPKAWYACSVVWGTEQAPACQATGTEAYLGGSGSSSPVLVGSREGGGGGGREGEGERGSAPPPRRCRRRRLASRSARRRGGAAPRRSAAPSRARGACSSSARRRRTWGALYSWVWVWVWV